jgi:hypothetical protein
MFLHLLNYIYSVALLMRRKLISSLLFTCCRHGKQQRIGNQTNNLPVQDGTLGPKTKHLIISAYLPLNRIASALTVSLLFEFCLEYIFDSWRVSRVCQLVKRLAIVLIKVGVYKFM